MSSAPMVERRARWRSLAFRINAWYVVVFVASIAALVASAVPTVRRALDRADTVVVEDRVERHVAVLATGLAGVSCGGRARRCARRPASAGADP